MRATDFINFYTEDSNTDSKIETVVSLVHDKINDGELPPKLPTQMIIRLIQNTGLASFNIDDLISVNEKSESLQNLIKNITPDYIEFVTRSSTNVANTQSNLAAADNPTKTVSDMAKDAMKRRQD